MSVDILRTTEGIEQHKPLMNEGIGVAAEQTESTKVARNSGPRKSPSAPNFHEKTYAGHSMSEPTLLRNCNGDNLLNLGDNLSFNDRDANLSVINLYDDEVISRQMDDFEDNNDEDSQQNVDSDEGNTPTMSMLQNNCNGSETEHLDRYGFKKQNNFITVEEYNKWWKDYSQYCIRRKHKWKLLLAKSGLPMDNDSPNRFPSRSEKLKRYVRKGIPAEWRGNAWWYFARGQEKLTKNKGLYDKLLQKMDDLLKKKKKKKPMQDLDIIERDLNRTFPDNIHFQRETFQLDEPPMIKSLRRVLVAFSLYNPKIGYCQSMNFLAGLLLLFMDEEKAFWMLVIITSRYLPGVHNVNLEGVNVDQGVLMLCVKEYLPEIWPFIAPLHKRSPINLGNSKYNFGKNEFLYRLPPITLCTASWFMSCFVGVLPIETTLRVWDCLFYEESHFLFKASLAILKLSEQTLLKNRPQRVLRHYSLSNGNYHSKDLRINQDESEMEVFQVIQSFPKHLINPNDIFDKVIFKKRVALNRLDQDEIDRCRKYVTTQRQRYKNYNEIVGSNLHHDDDEINDSNAQKNDLLSNGPQDYGSINNENNEEQISGAASDMKVNSNNRIGNDLVNNALSSEVYGFKKSLSGVHWNNSIKEKVRQMRKKRGKDDDVLL
ncbi:hypothetical protein HG535_0F02330 [Zygotorulaspora mrakii]|uniref:Rab-GAP TBC domain-containing protein n=1 Tax=Zygotorulaspora mrakii TaxID=42260 RepID=A0A7H9B7L6_ZYGMR|nr:uncharacterized protein HG535_0F02330 [Zygotorulaspora mrakii]QLG73722.1 hypothetical protein HG535_0F02330 [Zygotorulaspora mrakii]